MRLLHALLLNSFLSLLSLSLFASPAFAELPTVELSIGMHRIEAEVAATPADRAQGLMHRRTMSANHGMIFVFPETAGHCFWMRNTPLPLSIAFLDERGAIINIDEMAPETDTSHCPTQPARFALEMNRGWFKAKGLKPGMTLRGIERLPAGR